MPKTTRSIEVKLSEPEAHALLDAVNEALKARGQCPIYREDGGVPPTMEHSKVLQNAGRQVCDQIDSRILKRPVRTRRVNPSKTAEAV